MTSQNQPNDAIEDDGKPLPTPIITWTPDGYTYLDGTERGICQHATTTDVLDLLSAGAVPSLQQLHDFGDDWGFRDLVFADEHGRVHRLQASSYRRPSCFESRGPLQHEVTATMDRIQARALVGGAS